MDSFIEDKDKAIWIAHLSNGQVVYQDDERYGDDDRAWLRLMKYCSKNKVFVKSVYIKFRSHTEKAVENDGDGIFYRRKALGSPVDKTRHYYLFGVCKDGKIEVHHWLVPEVILEESDIRDIEGCEDTIIWNKKSTSRVSQAKKLKEANS